MDFKKEFGKEIHDVNEVIKNLIPDEPREVYGMLLEYIMRGGKRIRPVLLLTTLQAFGGEYEKGLLPSAIIEIFHNFTLIHDDIEDDSKFRRGKPTLHEMYGVPIALNSGDALYTLVWNTLNSLKIDNKEELIKLYGQTFQEVVEGQGYDLWWERKEVFDLSEEDYLMLARKKTGALMGLSVGMGVFLSGNEGMYPHFYEFGSALGVAFQIQDDLLNLFGEFEKYKKKIGDDITEGKRTLMVVYALNHLSKEKAERLKQILRMHTSKEHLIKEAIGLIEESGAREYAKKYAKKIVKKELERIKQLLPNNKFSKKLERIAKFVINREV